jgi:hypothetical protein
MIHSVQFTCLLDTNVIYPLPIRDLLFWFAHYELYTPKWSEHIFDEWAEVMRRRGIPEPEIIKRLDIATRAFPDALVKNYSALIDSLRLPDEKDRHVLAAAIKSNATIIVTNNLKDFPKEYLRSFGLTAKGVDDFIADIIDLNRELAVLAFREMVLNRKNPAMDEFEALTILRKYGLNNSANYLHSLI